jgi:DNA polymerase III subunit delta
MIIFIHGADSFSSQEKLKQVIEQFKLKRDKESMNVVRLDGATLDFDHLRQEAMTQGFLSPKKMIVVKDLLSHTTQELLETVTDFLKDFSKKDQDNVLVFYQTSFTPKKRSNADKAASKLFEFLKKQKYTFEFPELSGVKLNSWISQKVSALSGQIKPQAARELAALVGSNLWQLNNEVNKLVAYKKGREITTQDVEQEVRGNYEANIFALTDAVAAQNKAQALKLLQQELEAGANEIYLLTMITRQFRILIQLQTKATTNITPDKIAKDLKLHPYVVKKTLPLARKYKPYQLKNIYQKLLRIDQSFKTSHPNPELLLDLLIVND